MSTGFRFLHWVVWVTLVSFVIFYGMKTWIFSPIVSIGSQKSPKSSMSRGDFLGEKKHGDRNKEGEFSIKILRKDVSMTVPSPNKKLPLGIPKASRLSPGVATSSPTEEDNESWVTLKKKIIYESHQVGKLNPDPKETKKRLAALAEGLTEEEKNYLSQQAIGEKAKASANADLRFLSVYLLNKNGTSFKHLMNIARHPIEVPFNQRRLFEQEVLLRAMALEGIVQSLSPDEAQRRILEFISQQDNTMLIHQARQLLFRVRKM